MTRFAKIVIGLVLGVAAVQQAGAFSMYGPLETWQTADLGYGPNVFQDQDWNGPDLGGPKNLGDEYRLTTAVVTYGFDASFVDYFGAKGIVAVDQAMAMLNAIPAASNMSPDLSEFLTEGVQRINYRAAAAGLIDLKSIVLSHMLDHMGLIGETHVWDLRGRTALGGTCTFQYGVIQRNFDPITFEPTEYVNGRLYHYQIMDLCEQGGATADAVEEPWATGVTSPRFSAVATWRGLKTGGFYIALSRDDMGGLRHLYRRDNFNYESLPTDASFLPVTNRVASPWSPYFGTIYTNVTVTVTRGGSPFAPFSHTNYVTNFTAVTNLNALGLHGGLEKVTYAKMRFDSTMGTGFLPMVINYSVPTLNSNVLTYRKVVRTNTVPDILFSADDIVTAPNYSYVLDWTMNFINTSPSAKAGPGVIDPTMTITLSKLGRYYLNENPYFMTDERKTMGVQWGSFDGSTNEPIMFPNGTSIREWEALLLSGQNE